MTCQLSKKTTRNGRQTLFLLLGVGSGHETRGPAAYAYRDGVAYMSACASKATVIMAAKALEMIALYLLMSQGTRFDVDSNFQESNIVPDVISTAPPIAAEVSENNSLLKVCLYSYIICTFEPVVNVLHTGTVVHGWWNTGV